MRRLAGAFVLVSAACSSPSTDPATSFFVTSQTNPTGDLGGLSGADAQCQRLATAVGVGQREWRAFLSAEHDPEQGGAPVHARDRIGVGPWSNANGATLAENLDELLGRTGDADVFVDEQGRKINGYWKGSPGPAQHDIQTGTARDGTLLPGLTCDDWTSSSTDFRAMVGHTDGFDSDGEPVPPNDSWTTAHVDQDCSDTAPYGGAGRIYCFAAD